MAGRPDALTITDPQALRAIAHPARQRLIAELYVGEVLTATEASRLVGLTPSATSYHLRALERWGIATRDETTGDRRERPWRSAATSIAITPEAHRLAGSTTSRRSLSSWFEDLQAGVHRMLARADQGSDEVGMVSRERLWLTPEEGAELQERLQAVVREYGSRSGRSRWSHPEEVAPWEAYVFLMPAQDDPEKAPGRGPRSSEVD